MSRIWSSWSYRIAFVGQTFSHTLHLPFRKKVHWVLSMTGLFGTACGNGEYMAGRKPSPSLNSLRFFLVGHFWEQRAQPVQSLSSTQRAFLRIFTLKFPMKPSML